jgi:schlafen family protein
MRTCSGTRMNDDLLVRFRGLTSQGILALRGEIEGGHLDCKEVSDIAMRGRDAKRLLARILSGFANSEGGLILWGVTAKKNEQQIDCITDFPGVSEPDVFTSRLNELTPEALSPGVSGIDHRMVRDDPSTPPFVVTAVPASDAGPHMALLGEHRYYQRIGQATLPMEHFQLADMFGRRPQASLRLRFLKSEGYLLSVNFENIGRGIASAPYLLFYDVSAPYVVSPYPGSGKPTDFPLPKVQPAARQGVDGFVGSLDHLIHPGLYLTFRCLQLPNAWSSGTPPSNCSASFRFGAAGVMEHRGNLVYDFSKGAFEVLEGAEA